MLTKRAAFIVAFSASVITIAASAEEAPPGKSPTYSTSGFMASATSALNTSHRGRGPTNTNSRPATQSDHEPVGACALVDSPIGAIVQWDSNGREPDARRASNMTRGGERNNPIGELQESDCVGGIPSWAHDGTQNRMDDVVKRRIGVTEESVAITCGAFHTATGAEKSAATPARQLAHHYGKSVGQDAPFLAATKAF